MEEYRTWEFYASAAHWNWRDVSGLSSNRWVSVAASIAAAFARCCIVAS